MPTKKKSSVIAEVEAPRVVTTTSNEVAVAPVAEVVELPETSEKTEEILDTRGDFSLVRRGTEYVVLQVGVQISPASTLAEAEQLFRGMTRKF